jgi:hypothetical protein
MDETEARTVVQQPLTLAVPGADRTGLAPDPPFRDPL